MNCFQFFVEFYLLDHFKSFWWLYLVPGLRGGSVNLASESRNRLMERYEDRASWPIEHGVIVRSQVSENAHANDQGLVILCIDIALEIEFPDEFKDRQSFKARFVRIGNTHFSEVFVVGREVKMRKSPSGPEAELVEPMLLRGYSPGA